MTSALEEKRSSLELLSALGTVENEDLDLEGGDGEGGVSPVEVPGSDAKAVVNLIFEEEDDEEHAKETKKDMRHSIALSTTTAATTAKKGGAGYTSTTVGTRDEPAHIAEPTLLLRDAPVSRAVGTPGAYSAMGNGRLRRLEPSNSVRSLRLASTDDGSLEEDESVSLDALEPAVAEEGAVVLEGSLVLDTSGLEAQEGNPLNDLETDGTMDAECNSSGHLSLASMDLVDGKVIADGDPKHQKPSRSASTNAVPATVLVLVILVGLAVFLGLYFGVFSVKGTDPPGIEVTDDPFSSSSSQPMIVYPPFENGTMPVAITKAIEDVGSPQYHANQWMLEDPYRETYSLERQYQRFHMVTWYYICNGQTWLRNDHWLSYNVSECSWYNQVSGANLYGYESLEAVGICNNQSQILTFNLSANNLTGTFGQITHFLPHMRRFDISKNYVGGLLPVMAYQPKVEVYDVSDNQFDGILVGSFSSFGIKVIKTHGNALFGYTPGLWQFVKQIEHIDCSENLYNSPLVTQMGLCREMKTINLSNNLYYGNIPSELGSLPLLQNYNISNNHEVNGTIPSEFGLLSTLEIIDLSGTRVSGDIPEPLCERYREGILQIVANCSHLNCCT